VNPIDIDIVIARLAALRSARRDEKLVVQAVDLNDRLEVIETRCSSVRAREAAMEELLRIHPRAAVAAIADVRGFHNLARIARRVIREEMVA
jgi:hypothetical protein